MRAIEEKLTYAEFQVRYERADLAYEYWMGNAIPKAAHTWIHGLLQGIIGELLNEAGYTAGASVELRIIPDAHPKPDIIATSGKINESYPSKAVDVVVEILSTEDPMLYVLEKCEAYRTWGFEHVYVVNPDSRQVFRWTGSALEVSEMLTSIPVTRIWERLDRSKRKRQ